jgi:hypothetical protein
MRLLSAWKMGTVITIIATAALVASACSGGAAGSNPLKAFVTLVTEGHEGGSMGPDGLKHDTVIPADFTVYKGQAVELTMINYDEGPHTITSDGLGIHFQYPGAKSDGVPSVTQFNFTPARAGVFEWYCALPCDAGQGGWAMTQGPHGEKAQPGFMDGNITVLSP